MVFGYDFALPLVFHLHCNSKQYDRPAAIKLAMEPPVDGSILIASILILDCLIPEHYVMILEQVTPQSH